jgi:nucleotide-binding universal stress UspA family protein
MKKIIAAFDGLKYSDSTEKYVLEIAKKYNVRVCGVFLEDFTYHSYKLVDMIGEDDVDTVKADYLRKFDVDTRENAIKIFNQRCANAGILHSTHRDRNIAIQELTHESLFADLIVIQNNESLSHYAEKAPTNFISNLLERSECPVMIVPPMYKRPEKTIFLYDGEPSSIQAIKMYAYLFPGESLRAELVTVRKNKEDKVVPDSHLLKEWLKLNYPETRFKVILGDPNEEIPRYLLEQVENVVVVLGAYGRGSISRMIHRSLADTLITNLDIPLFIFHK